MFCERIMEEGCHLQLNNLFSTSFIMGKAIIAGVEFNALAKVISSAISIPSHGENWFKGMDLDLEHYKQLLKPYAREKPEYLFPFKNLLNKYAPLMMLIMNYFTCEGIFSRLYRYLLYYTTTPHLFL